MPRDLSKRVRRTDLGRPRPELHCLGHVPLHDPSRPLGGRIRGRDPDPGRRRRTRRPGRHVRRGPVVGGGPARVRAAAPPGLLRGRRASGRAAPADRRRPPHGFWSAGLVRSRRGGGRQGGPHRARTGRAAGGGGWGSGPRSVRHRDRPSKAGLRARDRGRQHAGRPGSGPAKRHAPQRDRTGRAARSRGRRGLSGRAPHLPGLGARAVGRSGEAAAAPVSGAPSWSAWRWASARRSS